MKEVQRPETHADKDAPRLPRHVENFLGQVLRNRLHDTVISPIPDAMTKLIEAMRRQNVPPRPDGQD